MDLDFLSLPTCITNLNNFTLIFRTIKILVSELKEDRSKSNDTWTLGYFWPSLRRRRLEGIGRFRNDDGYVNENGKKYIGLD